MKMKPSLTAREIAEPVHNSYLMDTIPSHFMTRGQASEFAVAISKLILEIIERKLEE